MGVYGREIGSRYYSLHSIALLIDTTLYLVVILLYNTLFTYTIQKMS